VPPDSFTSTWSPTLYLHAWNQLSWLIRETTEGIRLQVSFSVETALIYAWQVVEEGR